jgi:sugar phosphate isomerase/epimerase
LSDEFERFFKSSIERWGVTPTCYGTYADPFMLKGRDLNDDELVEYTVPQLISAAQLGFKTARLQYFASRVAERLLPWAEKLDLRMGYELHTPLTIESSETQGLIEQIEKLDTPYLGLIPDTGIFARSIPEFCLAWVREAGVGDEIAARAAELWNAKIGGHEAAEELQRIGLRKENISTIERIWGSFGHSEPGALLAIMPRVIHMHGKFYSMKDGDEPDIRFEEVVKVLVEYGYDGWMSSEYEGANGVDTFNLVREHQAMVRRYAEKYA